MNKEERQKYATDIVRFGSREEPIEAERLAGLWRTTKRGVREVVYNLRISGLPICSGNNGYWYATTNEETLETVRRIRAHALKELKAVSKMARVLRKEGHRV